MEAHIEEPVSPMLLAQDAGMSTRQLERLFRRYLNRSPKRYYMELRLGKARNLLMQTDMSVINVALACGFASPSHFSKCYRALYQTTPYRERGASDEAAPAPATEEPPRCPTRSSSSPPPARRWAASRARSRRPRPPELGGAAIAAALGARRASSRRRSTSS